MCSTRSVQKCSGIRAEIFADLFDIKTREYNYRNVLKIDLPRYKTNKYGKTHYTLMKVI